MLFTLFPVSAYDFEVDGIYYSALSLDDLTCQVVAGDKNYRGNIEIPTEATYNNHRFSVIRIGESAFSWCLALDSVKIPNSIKEIGKEAFAYCDSLTSVNLPNSISEIGDGAFVYCRSLTSITIPDSVTKIKTATFYYCESLTSLTIPNSVTEIEANAFCYCKSLTSITIPNSVTEIGSSAFEGCVSLKNIELSESLKEIPLGLFSYCCELETLNIPGSIERIPQYGDNYLHKYRYTFEECEKLTNLSLLYSPKSLSTGYYIDEDNSRKYVNSDWDTWTDSIKILYIDRSLYRPIRVSNIEKLVLGNSLKDVQVEEIAKLEKLTTIISQALEPPTLPEMSNYQYMHLEVNVPEEALEAYREDPIWGKFWNLQTSKVGNIGNDLNKTVIGRYDLSGAPVDENYNGLVIVRFSDGSTKKVLQK